MTFFPPLDDFQETRKTLHNYAQAAGVIPRAHGIRHPKWWHISLKVGPEGMVTDNVPLPGGGVLGLRMDVRRHQIVLATSSGDRRTFSMRDGATGSEMGDQIIAAVADYGLRGEYEREKFESDEPRVYSAEAAGRYFTALVNADRTFKKHKANLSGEMGPVQVWPHGFDLAFEWFGSRVQTYEEEDEVQEYPAQLNLGFYPGGPGVEPYFFSNPWPFEAEELLGKPLPEGARWHTEGFEGTILPYEELVGDPDAESRLLEYAQAVYELAAPTLTE